MATEAIRAGAPWVSQRGGKRESTRRKGRGPGSALGAKVFCSRVWVGGSGQPAGCDA